jgi:hypothetical protein
MTHRPRARESRFEPWVFPRNATRDLCATNEPRVPNGSPNFASKRSSKSPFVAQSSIKPTSRFRIPLLVHGNFFGCFTLNFIARTVLLFGHPVKKWKEFRCARHGEVACCYNRQHSESSALTTTYVSNDKALEWFKAISNGKSRAKREIFVSRVFGGKSNQANPKRQPRISTQNIVVFKKLAG